MPNRYVCSVLEELRTVIQVHVDKYDMFPRDRACLLSLVEEIQIYVNRMEASLADDWDMYHKQEQLAKLKKEQRALKNEIKKLEAKKAKKKK